MLSFSTLALIMQKTWNNAEACWQLVFERLGHSDSVSLSLGKGLPDVYFNQENFMMSFSVQLGIVKSLSLKLREGVSLSESTDG